MNKLNTFTEEQLLNSVVEWYEPHRGIDENGNECKIHVQLSSPAMDCVKAARYYHNYMCRKRGMDDTTITDSDALSEFLMVHWGAMIDTDVALRNMVSSGHILARDIILMALWNPNGVGAEFGAIVRRTGIEKTRVSQVVKSLETQGLAEKMTPLADHRKNTIYLTVEGRVSGGDLWKAFRHFAATEGPKKSRWYGRRDDGSWKFLGDVPGDLARQIAKDEGIDCISTEPDLPAH